MPPEPRSRFPLGGNGPPYCGLERPGSSRQLQHVMCHLCHLAGPRWVAGVWIVHRVTRPGNLIGSGFLQDCRARLAAVDRHAKAGHKVTLHVSCFVRPPSQSARDGHVPRVLTSVFRGVFANFQAAKGSVRALRPRLEPQVAACLPHCRGFPCRTVPCLRPPSTRTVTALATPRNPTQ